MTLEHAVEAVRELSVPPGRVFDALVRVETAERWWHAHRHFPTGHEPPAVLEEGTRFRQRAELFGIPVGLRWMIDQLERPKLLLASATGPNGSHIHITTSVTRRKGGGSRVRSRVEFGEGILAGTMGASMRRHVETAVNAALADLANLLEDR